MEALDHSPGHYLVELQRPPSGWQALKDGCERIDEAVQVPRQGFSKKTARRGDNDAVNATTNREKT